MLDDPSTTTDQRVTASSTAVPAVAAQRFDGESDRDRIRALATQAGIERVHVLAWRDLNDVEAGGSEVHAARICREWAGAGIEVITRTSFAQGHPPEVVRDGYRVIRRAGRYLVFPRAAFAEITRRTGPRDALIEVWNGMPFFSPLWDRGPRLVFLHHVHGEMWKMVLPPNLATVGDTIERRIAPLVYRRSRIVTLSPSSRTDMISQLGLSPDRVDVVPPGIDDQFVPGGARSANPSIVAVGRLVPMKHFDRLIRLAARVREHIGDLRVTIVGEGYERVALGQLVDDLDAHGWVTLTGWVSEAEKVRLYQQAWVLAATSSHEGWGMTATEAAACATPSIVTDIPGHRDAVTHNSTGLLVGSDQEFVDGLRLLLGDADRREAMGAAAHAQADQYRWSTTAARLMAILADEAARRSILGRR